MRWGIYDTQENLWIGDDRGPRLFSEEDVELARLAANIYDIQMGNSLGRMVEKVYIEQSLILHDTQEIAIPLHAAIKVFTAIQTAQHETGPSHNCYVA